jgi:hypothetical protein
MRNMQCYVELGHLQDSRSPELYKNKLVPALEIKQSAFIRKIKQVNAV